MTRARAIPVRLRFPTVALFAMLVVPQAPPRAAAERQTPAAPTFDSLLSEYRAGDRDVVSRTVQSSRDVRILSNALGAGLAAPPAAWDETRAAFVLEIAVAESKLSPPDAVRALTVGREALIRHHGALGSNPRRDAFELRWHETALAVLQGMVEPAVEATYLNVLDSRYAPSAPADVADAGLDPRLQLDRAIAEEQARWRSEPGDQPTTRLAAVVKATDTSPRGRLYRIVVRDFERAEAHPDVAAEATVRAAAALFRVSRYAAARASADRVEATGADEVERYWAALIAGRARQALGQFAEAAENYRQASRLYPTAETPRTGLAVALLSMNRRDDAVSAASGVSRLPDDWDPWWSYYGADARFVQTWLVNLRASLR